MTEVTAVILAAGLGERMKSSVPKQFLTVGNEQLLDYSISALQHSVDRIIVTLPSLDVADSLKHQDGVTYVKGGVTRTQSVSNALNLVDTDLVLVHDAARPFATKRLVAEVIAELDSYAATCPVMPVVNSIVVDRDGELESTPERASFREVQTPQGFHTDILREAIATFGEDHAHLPELVRRLGHPVKHVDGSPWLFKVTYAPSLAMAAYYVEHVMHNEEASDV